MEVEASCDSYRTRKRIIFSYNFSLNLFLILHKGCSRGWTLTSTENWRNSIWQSPLRIIYIKTKFSFRKSPNTIQWRLGEQSRVIPLHSWTSPKLLHEQAQVQMGCWSWWDWVWSLVAILMLLDSIVCERVNKDVFTKSQNGLEGLKSISSQLPCCGQGHLSQDEFAQSSIHPGLAHFQGWDIHDFSGNLFQCFTILIVKQTSLCQM